MKRKSDSTAPFMRMAIITTAFEQHVFGEEHIGWFNYMAVTRIVRVIFEIADKKYSLKKDWWVRFLLKDKQYEFTQIVLKYFPATSEDKVWTPNVTPEDRLAAQNCFSPEVLYVYEGAYNREYKSVGRKKKQNADLTPQVSSLREEVDRLRLYVERLEDRLTEELTKRNVLLRKLSDVPGE